MISIAGCLIFTLCILQVPTEGRKCHYAFYATKDRMCLPCQVRCGPGEKMAKNCGYDQFGDRIPGIAVCKKCEENEYSTLNGTVCSLCKECKGRPKDKQFKKLCTSTANAVCEDCPEGYTSDYEDNCKKVVSTSKAAMTASQLKSIRQFTTSTYTSANIVLSTTKLPTVERTKSQQKVTKKLTTSKLLSILLSKKKSTQKYHTLATKMKSTDRVIPVTSSTSHSVVKSRSTTPFKAYTTPFKAYTTPVKAGLQLHTHSGTKVENIPKNHLFRSFLLIAALIGVMIVVVLVVMFTKSMKNKRNMPKHKKISSDDLGSNCTRFTGISIIDEDEKQEYRDEDDGEVQENEEEKEVEIIVKQHFQADSGRGLKAVPFELSSDDASYTYLSVNDQPDQDGDESESVGISVGCKQNSHSFYRIRKNDPRYGEVPLIEASTSNNHDNPYDRCGQQAPKRCKTSWDNRNTKKVRHCFHCKQISDKERSLFDRELTDLKECQKRTLKQKLDLEIEGTNNWKEVATYFNISQDTIRNWTAKFKAGDSPTESVIYYLGTQSVTVGRLLECLTDLKRYDARDALVLHVQQKCCICRENCVSNK